jgi:hypothetical protein
VTKRALKVASIVTAGAIASAAAVYVARDGGRPPSDRTRSEVSLSVAPAADAPVFIEAASPRAAKDSLAETALTTAELDGRLAASEPGARDLVLQAALPAMVAKNPDEIARFAELQTDPQLRELLIRQIAQLWAKTDTDRAMAWARSLPDSPERVATLIDVSLAVALTDPPRAISLREPDVGNIEPDGVLDGLVQQWAEKDFDAAFAWTNARPQNAQRGKLLQRLVYVRAAGGAPDAAARLVEEAFEDGALKQEAIAIVAQQWTLADPVAAGAWLETLGHPAP